MNTFGYFNEPYQSIPASDPGLDMKCPVCYKALERPVVTISFMVPNDNRSYFYRIHKTCNANQELQTDIESVLVDAIVHARQLN